MLRPRDHGLAIASFALATLAGCELSEVPSPPAAPVAAPPVTSAGESLTDDPALTGEALDRRGDEHLLAGRFVAAVRDFDGYVKATPKAEPYHWRRGIAYYYAGRFKAGVRQFELHRSVNSDDVENAVWHLLCNAKIVGVKKARTALLPVGPDGRVPMMTIYEMFAGRKTPADVLREAEAAPARAQSEPPLFYAHLYIGLHHLVLDEPAKALGHIEIAAKKHTSSHYMGDLARMHAAHFQK